MFGFRRLFEDCNESFRVRFAGFALIVGKALEGFGWVLRAMEITCNIDLES